MAKCDYCGKGVTFGIKVSHSHRRANRTWKPNVKRVIGLPGETVQIKNGQIYIDDKPLEADKGLGQVSLAGLAENPVVLEEDEYFLLGDNRDSSEDSRFVKIGNVKRRQIRGKVWLRLIPFIDFKLVE